MGLNIEVPDGYQGVELVEQKQRAAHVKRGAATDGSDNETAEDQRQFKAVDAFTNFMVWDHDQAPFLLDNPYMRTVQWLKIAQHFHHHC